MITRRNFTYNTIPMLKALDFEVFGRVQGVYFRAYTQQKGQELGLKGWCMNTSKGTVVGQLEGEESGVEEMKRWLQSKGSPQSCITKTVFQNEKEIAELSFKSFDIRK
ncbi:acylphosphatase-2-like [Polistes fuscatus]|uniref:acylphosphatase-2-like n=1 Tax=Polistes fuscatus TaxID=30207 RepID=UPI001CA8E4BF|nr:acylphosphatase-2-like [Polistes fuscatus]